MRNVKHTNMYKRFISLMLLLLIAIISFSQSKTQLIDELVKKYHENGQFNGTVLVAEKGKLIYKKGFGMANMEWKIPNQPDTKFRIGSITKQFTSMLIMQLVEQGKLKLDVPITTYLPDYPKKTGDSITIHHLLTHTSGIPNYTSFPNFDKTTRDPYKPEEFVKVFADSTLRFKPGEKFSYSNSGYFLLGVIVEKVTGKTYEQVLQENILTPLKMKNTGYDYQASIITNRAAGYERKGLKLINASYLDMSVPYAAGSMYSTVEDLFTWNEALYRQTLLKTENIDKLFGKYIAANKNFHYGYGWLVGNQPVGNTKETVPVVFHGGGINGFVSLITRIPADKSFIVILNNTGVVPSDKMNFDITAILLGKTYDMPKKSLSDLVIEITLDEGINRGIEEFRKNRNAKEFKLIEADMNKAGYYFLQIGKIKEAIELFKLNVEAFPNSSNVYDSLGEAYLKDGNKEMAKQNYQKSLELDPKNENAARILKTL